MRRCASAALSLVWGGCAPLVATVGVEGEDSSQDAGGGFEPTEAGLGAMDASPTGAARPPLEDAGAVAEDAAEADAARERNCIVLPDLVDVMARTDGGVTALDSGVIWVATDSQQGCPMPAASTYIYGRVDATPLVPSGMPYSVRWPASTGTGAVNMVSTKLQCGGEPLVLPFFLSVVVPLLDGCAQPQPGTFMRVVMGPPSPFPLGLRLCEGGCQ